MDYISTTKLNLCTIWACCSHCSGAGHVWRVMLDAITDSGPYTITATLECQDNPLKVEIKNVLFGDVWVCAGQQNMQFSVDKVCLNPSMSCSLYVVGDEMQMTLTLWTPQAT